MEHNPIIAGGSDYLSASRYQGANFKRKAAREFFAIIGLRSCPKCNSLKPVAGFHKSKSHPSGLAIWCKDCAISHANEHYSNNKGLYAGFSAKYREKHKSEICEIGKKYRAKNKKVISQNKMKRKRERRKEDHVYRLIGNVRRSVARCIANAGYTKRAKAHTILGCDYATFSKHIEAQFTKGMSWEKIGVEIHIDHIVPVSSAKTEADVLALNHYTNLRPLWAADNIRKSDNIEFLI